MRHSGTFPCFARRMGNKDKIMESYAVIKSGGKQYRVTPGDVVQVEKLAAAVGTVVDLQPVLAVGGESGFRLGTPALADVRVTGTVTEVIRGRKVISFKQKRRKGYSRKIGHRQHLTVCRVDAIEAAAPQQ